MSKYSSVFNTQATPQNQPIPNSGQVRNNSIGYGWQVDKWQQLQRFLILGSESPTYYVNQQKLSLDNAQAVLECIKENGTETVSMISKVSEGGRAPKNSPAIFALAMCAKFGDEHTKRFAYQAMPEICRTATHLFEFNEYIRNSFGVSGKGLRKANSKWYNDKAASQVAYQVVKYRNRNNWTHKDILRLAHPKADTSDHNEIFNWIVNGWESVGLEPHPNKNLQLIWAFERAKRVTTTNEIVSLIVDYGLTWEMLPTEHLKNPVVWEALLMSGMPLTAMIRNLGKMSSIGLLTTFALANQIVINSLSNQDYLHKSRVHPLSILVALKTYAQGHGEKGSLIWEPVQQIVDALDEAFYLSFGNVEPTNENLVLALDVSGSMSWGNIAGMPLTPREASAAMALITANVESNYHILGFSHNLVQVNISPKMRLDNVVKVLGSIPMGATNCALPMTEALNKKIPVDGFVVYTDSETNFGSIHPSQALNKYNRQMKRDAKLVVVGMVANNISIADPNSNNMLDVCGFDLATPNVISGFVN